MGSGGRIGRGREDEAETEVERGREGAENTVEKRKRRGHRREDERRRSRSRSKGKRFYRFDRKELTEFLLDRIST